MDNNLEQLQKAKEQFKLKNLEENLQENKQEVKLKLNENVQIDSQNEQQLGDLNENLVNIQADKIAEAEAEPEVPAFMNSAVMIEKSFADAKEDDSDRMALIRQALKTYFEKRTELDGMNGADESVRMEKLKEVRAEAVNMLNQCRVYRSHRHPITKRGKERKRQVTELYEQVKIELLQLADYIQDVRRSMSEKTEPAPEPLKDIGLAVAKNGFRRLENIKKDDTLHKTDKKRLADKQFYGDSVNAELQREDLSSKER
ncbi:MAG: hypothetical protein K6E56_02885, partial [Lachnospiraceae bacterium]|nr:hypothetical protein [Lachnospiraceae bacterium]